MSTISTVPPLLEIATSETRTWPLDTTATLLAMALTGLATPVVSVIDPVTALAVTGATSAVAITGNIINATFAGSVLTLNKAYQIRWTAVSQGQTLAWITQLNVVA